MGNHASTSSNAERGKACAPVSSTCRPTRAAACVAPSSSDMAPRGWCGKFGINVFRRTSCSPLLKGSNHKAVAASLLPVHVREAAKGRRPGRTISSLGSDPEPTSQPFRCRSTGPVAQSAGAPVVLHGSPVPLIHMAHARPSHHAICGCHWNRRYQALTCRSAPTGCPWLSKCRAKIPQPSPSCRQELHTTRKPSCGLSLASTCTSVL
mmetsp:Transcript_48862/g.140262  ORF Transcript_48862/g.140262 Transcript_48862/m.140262 type:complete len:208 (-) Transcript_48862:152-775(-)